MKTIVKTNVAALTAIVMYLFCNIASAQANEKAEVYRLLIQANVMHDLDLSFTFNSKNDASCATVGRSYGKTFTTLETKEDHDCPLDFVCVSDLISYCAENYGTLECDDKGCTCYIC